ncbi:MAG: hypothetical protein Q8K26_04940, partial [Candidatus Gracilibacteria bacterium]|nr:hypothetical protein [Candidatus Gracilibacteria bacterium]
TFLKPFGIVDIHVFPSPDSITINNENYNNNSKTIFDLGHYDITIEKTGYLSPHFTVDITQKNPFYTDTVNLLRLPAYVPTGLDFDMITPIDEGFLAQISGTHNFWVLSKEYGITDIIDTQYAFVGGAYFTDGKGIFEYSIPLKKFQPLAVSKGEKLPICSDWKWYGEQLFCPDTRTFFPQKKLDTDEHILSANVDIILSNKRIYNQDPDNENWQYYEYQSGTLRHPESLIHVKKIPYILENNYLTPIDPPSTLSGSILPLNTSFDTIIRAREFGSESIVVGVKGGKNMFVVFDGEKRFFGEFGTINLENIRIEKLNGVYVFITKNSVYIYYKGSREIFNVIEAPIVGFADSLVFFKKDGKVSVLDLLRK